MPKEFFDEHKIFRFDFTKSKNAYIVDEINYTGLFLTDFIVETEKAFILIEFKNPNHPKAKDIQRKNFMEEILGATKKSQYDILEFSKDLAFEIGSKYKDTLLLKWAEEFIFDKPIHYIFIINDNDIDAGILSHFEDRVKGCLPLNIEKHDSIKKKMIESFSVLNVNMWNVMFKDLPIANIA